MIKSMTGYGKSECFVGSQKVTVELRSVNGKSADITIKTQLIPKDMELQVRNMIADRLYRGNIDVFATIEQSASAAKEINPDILSAYWQQIKVLSENPALRDLMEKTDTGTIFQTLLKMPEVVDNRKYEMTMQDKDALCTCISEALARLDEYRIIEGKSIEKDFRERVSNILSLVDTVETHEKERTDGIKTRIMSRLAEISTDYDANRLEQEMIYYLEKLDINEEKVRLRQHCKYFLETFEEDNPGKKLGFIAQEMGREINTMGSKANHAEIQKSVVKMKDELEKIKEQTLNTL